MTRTKAARPHPPAGPRDGRARWRRRRGWLALLAAVILLAPPLVMPLSAAPAVPAPCCCGDAGACLCSLLPGGGCGDDVCRLDDRPPLPADDGGTGDFPGVRLDLPASPRPLAVPAVLGLLRPPSPAAPRAPWDPPETPPPRA